MDDFKSCTFLTDYVLLQEKVYYLQISHHTICTENSRRQSFQRVIGQFTKRSQSTVSLNKGILIKPKSVELCVDDFTNLTGYVNLFKIKIVELIFVLKSKTLSFLFLTQCDLQSCANENSCGYSTPCVDSSWCRSRSICCLSSLERALA